MRLIEVCSSGNWTVGTLLWFQKMGFWTLLEGLLLFANALAILNEDRFLAPRGWTLLELQGGRRNTLKGQIIGLIHACQFLRLPLILFNIVIIVVKLFSGWGWMKVSGLLLWNSKQLCTLCLQHWGRVCLIQWVDPKFYWKFNLIDTIWIGNLY